MQYIQLRLVGQARLARVIGGIDRQVLDGEGTLGDIVFDVYLRTHVRPIVQLRRRDVAQVPDQP